MVVSGSRYSSDVSLSTFGNYCDSISRHQLTQQQVNIVGGDNINGVNYIMNKNNDVWNTLCPVFAYGYATDRPTRTFDIMKSSSFMDTTTNYSNNNNNNDSKDDVLKLYNMLTTTTMSLLLNDNNNNKTKKEGGADTTIPKRTKKKRKKVLFTDLSCKDLNGQDMCIGYFSSSVGMSSESVVGSDEIMEGDE